MIIIQTTVQHGPGNATTINLEEPEKCPICNHAIKPEHLASKIYSLNNSHLYGFSALYLCKHCYKSFILQCVAQHVGTTKYTFTAQGPYSIAPIQPNEEEFNELISEISPNFVVVYNQAFAAEAYGLNEIAGIGYRKALEFLIKDFLISENPTDEEIIKEMALGKCIQDKIDNSQLQTVAQRASWLGNDHTHYVQKYEDRDINDLKRLIRLSVHWISLILETKEAGSIEKK